MSATSASAAASATLARLARRKPIWNGRHAENPFRAVASTIASFISMNDWRTIGSERRRSSPSWIRLDSSATSSDALRASDNISSDHPSSAARAFSASVDQVDARHSSKASARASHGPNGSMASCENEMSGTSAGLFQ